ncbi:hypothetical protein EPN87_02575 [archaeon]|nr:MAG: hypothetical protein EPN87_02575 [archaeon]
MSDHQQLLDELDKKTGRYKKVRKIREKTEQAYEKHVKALKEETSLSQEILDLQQQLHDVGINRKIPLDTSQTLTYESVIKEADALMKDGRAVSPVLLAKLLDASKDQIREYLAKAVKDGRYETGQEAMYAFKKKFPIYYPKGRELPFLPSQVTLEEYQTMVNRTSQVLDSMDIQFTQQEFYKTFQPLVENIPKKKVMMSIPSILRAYVKKGILETNDMNTYKQK